jgi:hypothetical protein
MFFLLISPEKEMVIGDWLMASGDLLFNREIGDALHIDDFLRFPVRKIQFGCKRK